LQNYQPGPLPLHILHRNPRITAGIRRIKMYAGVIGSAVHTGFRRGLAIAAVHARFNLTNKGEKNAGRYIGGFPRLMRDTTSSSPPLPFPFHFQQKALNGILGGWTINAIGTFRSGEPLDARVGSNVSANGDRWFPDRPNLNPGFSNNPTSGVSKGCKVGSRTIPAGTPLKTQPCGTIPVPFRGRRQGTMATLAETQ
jgi:hypothetical protein